MRAADSGSMHKLIATLAGSPPSDEPLSETTEVEIGQELVFLVGPESSGDRSQIAHLCPHCFSPVVSVAAEPLSCPGRNGGI